MKKAGDAYQRRERGSQQRQQAALDQVKRDAEKKAASWRGARAQGCGMKKTTSAAMNTSRVSAELTPITRRMCITPSPRTDGAPQYSSGEKRQQFGKLSRLDETARDFQPSVRCDCKMRPERRLSLTARLV